MSKKSLGYVCTVLAISLSAFAARPAAAQASLTLSTAPDPAESVVTQLIATGSSTDNDTQLSVTFKAAGGQGCAANFEADSGTSAIYRETVKEVAFSNSVNHEFQTAGSYLLCGWLNDSGQPGAPVVATASLTVTVRPPHLSLSVAAPTSVSVGQTFQITTVAQAEVSRNVSEHILPNSGRGCAANASAAGETSGDLQVDFAAHGLYWSINGGPFSESANVSLRSAGQYLLCAYIEYPQSDSPPEISAMAQIAAVAPPPPCVVPTYAATIRLKGIEQAIRASGCTVGKVRHLASRRIRAGHLISLSATPGTHLSPGAAINVVVSTGPPCVVPHVSPGTALSIVERRLVANHCSVGKISAAHSRRYHRGRVLRLGARTGLTLASHAAIAIIIVRRF